MIPTVAAQSSERILPSASHAIPGAIDQAALSLAAYVPHICVLIS